ncbi:RNA 2',3'-cyclic phosphodiesterase [Gallaecimonas mangrovi]|uniref:RNA 2',3'-cyclic phosphodiesterase n=1 Tax=Gallaecimonas mangrovi TaxID=2291597 RepID=UPI000E20321D|nr:RNA 2',3'-cyclic phosphodiesterase [Gallaecimonas mangrovi]
MSAMRLFFGLSLTPTQAETVSQWRNQAFTALKKPVPEANFHLTLAFIGELADSKLPDLIAGAKTAPWSAFSVPITRFGQWPKAGIAYLAPHQAPEPLLQLAAKLQALSKDLGGFVDNRPYQPHLTLARGMHQPTLPSIAIPPFLINAQQFALYHSERGHYQVLATFHAQ